MIAAITATNHDLQRDAAQPWIAPRRRPAGRTIAAVSLAIVFNRHSGRA